ncbi:[protein-PII] uridylyltransferase [Algihabitans sp.]|uniref:[protein-PII] uridylyltransferase n=1 Tax=Algihabitans sp. TaxID=2821514 RepID=UPI003BA8C6A6
MDTTVTLKQDEQRSDSGAVPPARARRRYVSRPQGAGNRRAILDRGKLQDRMAALVMRASTPERARSEILELLKGTLAQGREEIRRRFEAGASGRTTAALLAWQADQIVRLIYDHVGQDLYPLANPSMAERLSLAAAGGYGRGELAPYSDIDLLFLLPYKTTPRSEQVIESVLYYLWDLGFKVGHATRSVDDCLRQARQDVTIATNLLESRFLWGDQALFLEFKSRYAAEVQAGKGLWFAEAKLAERSRRHQRYGQGSRYALEPNVKESKGGLRDLHTIFWLGKFLYQVDAVEKLIDKGVFTKAEARTFGKALEFLWTLRCWLHYQTGRGEERLTFDLQHAIAPLMGYTEHAGKKAVERFMKRYFLVAKDVGDLTRIFCAQIEAEHNRRSRFRLPLLRGRGKIGGFKLEGDRLTVKGPEHFADKPVDLLRLFQVAQANDLDIHPDALRSATQSLKHIDKALRETPKANQVFLDILTGEQNPETALRRMNEAGVLGRFLPDFGRAVSMMQFNMYHHYTVDEHTLFAIGILHAIEQGKLQDEAPIASSVVHKVLNRRVLFLAVLLHDIAKGRPGDHSEEGAKIAHRLCPRLGLSPEETETVAWLVLHHLAMSDTAFKRDIDDPKTIQDFAGLVQSRERLNLLLVLTVADIRAVGPGVWNAWKASLLRELYWRSEEVLSGGFSTEGRERRIEVKKAALRQALEECAEAFDPDWIEGFLERGYDAYWLSLDVETLVRHARLIRTAEAEQRLLTVDTRVDPYREATEVTIYTADHAGLFNRIAGALAVAGANVEVARIFTHKDGMALDIFWVRDAANGGAFAKPSKLAKLYAAIERTLSGSIRPLTELRRQAPNLPSRFEIFTVAPRVLIDNAASRQHTVIEVNGRDRPGLLYRLTLALARLGLMIDSAQITTYGERAVDSFYVHDALNSKIESPQRLRAIRKKLLEALEDGVCAPADTETVRSRRKSPAAVKTASKPTKSKKRVTAG